MMEYPWISHSVVITSVTVNEMAHAIEMAHVGAETTMLCNVRGDSHRSTGQYVRWAKWRAKRAMAPRS